MLLELRTPPSSDLVMTDADLAGAVKDRRSYSGIVVWVKGSGEDTLYPVYASSKKLNMVCFSSSELMAIVGGACDGIATRTQWSKMCNCSSGTIVLCTDSAAALGFVKRKGASRRTCHVDTMVYFMQAFRPTQLAQVRVRVKRYLIPPQVAGVHYGSVHVVGMQCE